MQNVMETHTHFDSIEGTTNANMLASLKFPNRVLHCSFYLRNYLALGDSALHGILGAKRTDILMDWAAVTTLLRFCEEAHLCSGNKSNT